MSSTNRGRDRNRADNYPTPPWCVDALLGEVGDKLHGKHWLEPCAGDGSIVRAVQHWRPELYWHAHELRPECRADLEVLDATDVEIGDYLTTSIGTVDVAITNPPFVLAEPFARKMAREAPHALLLLRLNFLGGAGRNAWLRKTRPDVYVLPERPSFANKCRGLKHLTQRGRAKPCKALLGPFEFVCPCGAPASPQTDSVEYAWFHWHRESAGRLHVLSLTPPERRARHAPVNPLDEILR